MTEPKPKRVISNFHLTEEARRLLKAIATAQGVSMTAMLEFMIRAEAERKGLR
jgi:hypothetical protein